MCIFQEQELYRWHSRIVQQPQLATSFRELRITFRPPNNRRSRATDRLIQAAREVISAASSLRTLYCNVAFLPSSPNLERLHFLYVSVGRFNDGWLNLFAIKGHLPHLAFNFMHGHLDMEAIRRGKGNLSASHLTLSQWQVEDGGTPTALLDCMARPPRRLSVRSSQIVRPAWTELMGKYGPRLRDLHVDVNHSMRAGIRLYEFEYLQHFKLSDLAPCSRLANLGICARNLSSVVDVDALPPSLKSFNAVWHSSSLDFWQKLNTLFAGTRSRPDTYITFAEDWKGSDVENDDEGYLALAPEFHAVMAFAVAQDVTETFMEPEAPYIDWIKVYNKQAPMLAARFLSILKEKVGNFWGQKGGESGEAGSA